MALDYQTDRTVRFVGESEYKSLYQWSLQEFDDTGKQIGLPQVPWVWTLVFTATEVKLYESLKLEREPPPLKRLEPVTEDLKDWPIKIEEREHISAKLRPGYHGSDDDDVAYSMFGTGRYIKDFSLTIYKLEDDAEDERAHAWGSLQYVYEGVDFLPEVSEDTLGFYLHVRPARFAQYVERIRNYPPSIVTLQLRTVLGIYSEWSPTSRTDRVKVLTRAKHHKLEIAPDAAIKPRELGEMGEFEITFTTVREALKPPSSVDNENEEVEAILTETVAKEGLDSYQKAGQASAMDEEHVTQKALLQLAVQQRNRTKQLVYAAWVIAALVAILVFRH